MDDRSNKKLKRTIVGKELRLKYGEYEMLMSGENNDYEFIFAQGDDISNIIAYKNENFMNKLSNNKHLISKFINEIVTTK